MNRCELTGRLTRDVEIRDVGENKVARFTIAVDRRKKDESDFISCVAWNKTGEIIAKHFQKGAMIGVSGRIQTGSYTNREGNKVYTTDVVVDEFDFLEPKKKEAEEEFDYTNLPF